MPLNDNIIPTIPSHQKWEGYCAYESSGIIFFTAVYGIDHLRGPRQSTEQVLRDLPQ